MRDSMYTVGNRYNGTKKRHPRRSHLHKRISNNKFLLRRDKALVEMSRRGSTAIKPTVPGLEIWRKAHRKGLREFEKGNYGAALRLRTTALATFLALYGPGTQEPTGINRRFTRAPYESNVPMGWRQDADELAKWHIDDIRSRNKITRGDIRTTRRYGKKSKKKRVNTRKS
mgnify:CR=1 FL=1